MKWFINLIFVLVITSNAWSNELLEKRGGDDAGNGGFAYKQAFKILKLATTQLESKILSVKMPEFEKNPEWRTLLSEVLKYDHLDKAWLRTKYRNGQPLAMDYNIKKSKVIVLKHYFQSFMGKTDNEIEESIIDTQKRLVHEASHLWGYNEEESEIFSEKFLIYANNEVYKPSRDISFKPNYCSCRNGKPDILSNHCEQFCSKQPNTPNAILYLEAILGNETLKNPHLKNIHDWCLKQLINDGPPECFLVANDGENELFLPIQISPRSNSITSDITSLHLNKTYIIKIKEMNSETQPETLRIQIRRVINKTPNDQLGKIKTTAINQFTCINYLGTTNPDGTVRREHFLKKYFYHPSMETPTPIPYLNGLPFFVCHDESLYGYRDSILFPRLETINSKFLLFDKSDSRFSFENYDYKINSIVAERLKEEYGIYQDIKLINKIDFKQSHNQSLKNLGGYYLLPFKNTHTNFSFCPSESDYQSNHPLFKIMRDYFPEMEGLFIAESEPINIDFENYFENQFVKESDLIKNAFFIQDGLKVKIGNKIPHNKTIHFYYPFSDSIDPLSQSGRVLYTVRTPDELNKYQTELIDFNSSDKRIGCIPKY